jgi:hypothetical protein
MLERTICPTRLSEEQFPSVRKCSTPWGEGIVPDFVQNPSGIEKPEGAFPQVLNLGNDLKSEDFHNG